MRKLAVLATTAVAAAAALVAVPAANSASSVSVKDNVFSPKSTTISRGSTVTWRWRGRASHNVRGRGLSSATQRSGTYRKRFRRSGTYRYQCTIHSGMTGRIVVR